MLGRNGNLENQDVLKGLGRDDILKYHDIRRGVKNLICRTRRLEGLGRNGKLENQEIRRVWKELTYQKR